jgi:hypothetical protein
MRRNELCRQELTESLWATANGDGTPPSSMMSGATVRQLVVFQSRPVSRLRYTQLGVLARPLTRTPPRG